ncbi:MAG TPA: glutamate 5-kinase, partial [Caldimonas sp.]
MSDALRAARRIVVKVGSTLVTNEGRGIDSDAVGNWCRQIAELVRSGRELVMVSSGAIAEGMKRLGWPARPRAVHQLQAAA